MSLERQQDYFFEIVTKVFKDRSKKLISYIREV